MVDAKELRTCCEKELAFLKTDYAFKFARGRKESWGCRITAKNETTGVIVTHERRERSVFVDVCRLVDGELPPGPGEMTPNTVLHTYDLEDLVSLRAPEGEELQLQDPGQGDASASEHGLARAAADLDKYARDVLGGDFSVFEELDKIVKARAREAAFQKWGARAIEFGWRPNAAANP